ncbi:thioesterase-like superfamily-domain-containing protein [Epithele typhae]|uniref:thioesterase-like superfamily-domain-containing protein n=1 Tax=Epithele typhae TaxID=378194 RepID=UPI0020082CA8|nr:thioesterase-like superfamily-domain-containing protein [Epithele typhae]KAH9921991.1 thioesterase-like superfamily-domain-containing protein [Epithele typhae]
MSDQPVASSSRCTTPPPNPPSNISLTPEQVKRIELNRLKAKARQREREEQASSSSSVNANGKRPLGVIPATSTSPTGPKAPAKLKRDSRFGKYFEYDLSKMVNSKGGFLVEDGKEVDEELLTKEKERERQRAVQNAEPPMWLDPELNPRCKECNTMDIDQTFRKVFGCLVCNKCKNEKPEKYSLLTKTECKEDYLLTDPELRDQEVMPHLLKANPHKSTFANMMLFLRYQVEEFAWKKWGSPEALDAEWQKRVNEKKKKKNKKFENGLKELRRRTRETVWQKRKDQEHKHMYGPTEKGSDGVSRQICHMCGFSQITDALEVEQLDVSLFRSKTLRLPANARGVFGGQVISQALVSATQCVDSAYSLHVPSQCYFLLSASETVPILYHVDRIRDGRSYVTRGVRAVQRGRTVFMMLCSFHLPEPRQPVFRWPMPADVPPPDQCESAETMYEKQLAEATTEKTKAFIRSMLAERARSPIEVRLAGVRNEGLPMYMYWHKIKDRETSMKYDPAFQKCILSYISDAMFLGGGRRALAYVNEGGKGPTKPTMQTSLDHNISFYDDNLDCGDWLLYVIVSEVAYSGRTNVHGRMYSPSGSLIAVCNQEGLLRVDPNELTKAKPGAKL